mmetsp:Transcript_27470/g.56501  ORF Transcript_27470/g.56501 Transcript_27470/m.56501 type:complete len:201 (+) Transcript_27470:774-1376(+)
MTFLTEEESMAATIEESIEEASSLGFTLTTNTSASEISRLLFCSALFEAFGASSNVVCAIDANLRLNSPRVTSTTFPSKLSRASRAIDLEDSTPSTWWRIESATPYLFWTCGSFPEEARLASPSDPSASLPTRKTTAANAEESSPPMEVDSNERELIRSEIWEGLEVDDPFFHTMAGAAEANPRVMAIPVAIAVIFIVVV